MTAQGNGTAQSHGTPNDPANRSPFRTGLGTIASGLRQLLGVRWVRVVLVVFALLLLARAGMGLLLSRAINRLAAPRGLVCEWRDIDASLLTGRGEVRFLELRPRTEGEPEPAILALEYAVFHLELVPLLLGELRLRRAEVDGVDLLIERDAQGAWNLARHMPLEEVLELLEAPAEEREPAETKPLDLRPPLAIEALRVQNARLHLTDATVSPALSVVLEANAALSGLLTSDDDARFSATLVAPGALDGAHVDGSLRWTDHGMRLELAAQAGGLRLPVFAPWLAELDIHPVEVEVGGTARAELDLEVVGEARDTLRAKLALFDLKLSEGGAESLALDRLDLQLDELSEGGARVPLIELAGLRGRASLEAHGALRIAGIELDLGSGEASGGSPVDALASALELWTSEELPRWATLLVRPDEDAYPWTLGAFRVTSGEIAFTDRRIQPAAEFAIAIDGVDVGTIAHLPGGEVPAVPVSVRLSSPGVAEAIELRGEVDPFAPARALDLTLEVSGLGMDAFEGYLSRAGLERELVSGSFTARLSGAAITENDGRTEGWIEFHEVALRGDQELFRVGSIAARDLLFDPDEWLMRAGEVEISGLHLTFGRDPSNRIVALGLRTLGLAPPAAAAPASSTATPNNPTGAPAASAPPLLFQVGRFAWTNTAVAFTDDLVEPPRRIEFEELGFELTDLTLGGPPATGGSAAEFEPARFVARAVAPGLFDEFTLQGSVRSRPGAIDLTGDLELRATGLQGAFVAPYARAFGIEPAIDSGELAVDLLAALREQDGWRGSLTLTDGAVVDGGERIASLGQLSVEEVVIGDRIDIGSISIVDTFLGLARDATGRVSIGGVRLLDTDAPEARLPAEPLSLSWPELPEVTLSELTIAGAKLSWTDHAYAPAVETELVLDLAARDLSTTGTPGVFDARVHVPETVRAFTATGDLALSSDGVRWTSTVAGEGLAPGPIARMLPPGVSLAETDSAIHARLEVSASAAEAGGLRARVEVADFTLGSNAGAPSLGFASFVLEAPRVDPGAGHVELGPVALKGLTVDVRRDAEGRLHVPGLVLSPVPEVEDPAAAEEQRATALAAFPRVTLVDDVSIELERVTVIDEQQGPAAQPLGASVRFTVPAPVTLVDGSPLDLAPIAWRVDGAIDGLVEAWSLDGLLAPFAAEPVFEASLRATGVRTQGLVELAPELLAGVSGVVDQGELAGDLRATLFVTRARPTELGLRRPFGAELELRDLAFRASREGPVLIGLDGVMCEAKRIDLAQGLVHVELLELTTPRALVTRNDMRLGALGFEVDLSALGSDPDAEPTVEPARAEPAPVATAPTSPPEGELRLDTVLVTGIDVVVRDDSIEPPLVVALTELDAEVKQLSSKMLFEPRPVQFSALLGARGVFDEVALSGRIAPFPAPDGWASLDVSGLELPPFAGLAKQQGLDIEDGALDTSVRLRLKGEEGARVSTSLVFSDLALEEVEGGPIESTLGLPMALDSALFVLRNSAGEHRFSIGFSVGPDGVSRSQLVVAGTQAFAGVLAGALAGAPLRLLGALVPAGDKAPEPDLEYSLEFAAAGGELARAPTPLVSARRTLVSSGKHVAVVRHELSAEDVRRAERLANPTHQECVEIAERLRRRKSGLLRRREELGISVRTLFAVGAPEAAERAADLRAATVELLEVEDGLDRVLEILRSDSPRQHEKRTRNACREIAQRRVDAVVAELSVGLRSFEVDRIEARSPRFEVVEGLEAGGRVVIELRAR